MVSRAQEVILAELPTCIPWAIFLIQDGRQDGRRGIELPISPLLLHIDSWFWCQMICFVSRGIHSRHWKFSTDKSSCCIQDGRQDGRSGLESPISLLLLHTDSWIWCQMITFGGQRIHYRHWKFSADKYSCYIQDGRQDGCQDGCCGLGIPISPLLLHIDSWIWCQMIYFGGQGIHSRH